MFATLRSYACLGAFLLVSVIAGRTPASSAQNQAHAPTPRLKVISESLHASDITKIRELIKEDADVNVRNKYGVTPLVMASQDGHTEIVKLLLAANADVNAKLTKAGKDYTPLSIAKQMGHTQIVRLLEAAGAR